MSAPLRRIVLALAMCHVAATDTAPSRRGGEQPCHIPQPWAPMVASMWRQMRAHCSSGLCRTDSGSKLGALQNTTECHGRMLAYEFGLTRIPARAPQREAFDALQLETLCGVTPPLGQPAPVHVQVPVHHVAYRRTPGPAAKSEARAAAENTWYVDYERGSDVQNDGRSRGSPFKTVDCALAATRKAQATVHAAGTIILLPGVHYLADTVRLGASDSGLTITADPRAAVGQVWVSGGTLLPANWTKVPGPGNTYVTQLTDLDSVAGLNTLSPLRRVTRARYPNADPELCTDCWLDEAAVKHWHPDLSCVGKARVVYKNLTGCDNDMRLADGSPCKNDSAMWTTYNTYSNGHGGCCAVWSGDGSPYGPMGDYFCGNSSAGGWVGYDDPRQGNLSQGLSPALPVAMDYDDEFIAGFADPAGAIVHVWRAQGWFVNMFEVGGHDRQARTLAFAKQDGHVKGGWQGGRGWQVNHANMNNTPSEPDYLLAGKWMIENVREALDAPNEWFFNTSTRELFLWPNGTANATSPPSLSYVAVRLQTLISINATKDAPARDITIQGLSFRDAADVTMEPWGVPSGGDWGLFRGGAVFIEGCERCTVQHSLFERIDGAIAGFATGSWPVARAALRIPAAFDPGLWLRRLHSLPRSPAALRSHGPRFF